MAAFCKCSSLVVVRKVENVLRENLLSHLGMLLPRIEMCQFFFHFDQERLNVTHISCMVASDKVGIDLKASLVDLNLLIAKGRLPPKNLL